MKNTKFNWLFVLMVALAAPLAFAGCADDDGDVGNAGDAQCEAGATTCSLSSTEVGYCDGDSCTDCDDDEQCPGALVCDADAGCTSP